MRYFHRITENVNIFPIVQALHRQPELWNENLARTHMPGSPHAEVDDIWLRYCRVHKKSTVAKVINDCSNQFYPAWALLPQVRSIVFDLMRTVEGIDLGRIVITRLAPGRRIYPHIDSGKYAQLFDRYHVALNYKPGNVFKSGGEENSQIKNGDVWWFDNTVTHEIINNSSEDRLTMIIDYKCAE